MAYGVQTQDLPEEGRCGEHRDHHRRRRVAGHLRLDSSTRLFVAVLD